MCLDQIFFNNIALFDHSIFFKKIIYFEGLADGNVLLLKESSN